MGDLCLVAKTFSLVIEMWPCLADPLKPQPLHEPHHQFLF